MPAPLCSPQFSPALSKEFNAQIYLKPEIHSAPGSDKDRLGPATVAVFPASRSGALYGSHGAPRAPLNSPGEQPHNP